MRRVTLVGSTLLLAVGSLHCSMHSESGSESAAQSTGGTALDCTTVRGTFIDAADWPSGQVSVTCADASNVTLNGTAVSGSGTYALTPRSGLNILHVEGTGFLGAKTDMPFIYGSYLASGTPVSEALSVRINPTGWVNPDDKLHLPLVVGNPLDLSDVGTQVLRDQGDLLAQFDGVTKDVSGTASALLLSVPYMAGLTVNSLSYDSANVAITVVPNATGITLNLVVPSISGQFSWTASVLGVDLGDTVTVTADSLNLSLDVNLTYVPADGHGNAATIDAMLGGHQTSVQNLQIGTMVLDDLPLIGPEVEAALSTGTQYIVNNFGDGLFSMIQSSVVPTIATSLQQFHLPTQLPLPGNLGTLNFAETFDQGTFDATGDQISIGASISPATSVLTAPGSLTVSSLTSQFDATLPFGVSLAFDYVNQALYSVWVQGGLKAQILEGQTITAGVTTDPVVAEAMLPTLLMAKEDGSGLSLQQGEIEIGTTLHGVPSLGDVVVKVAVSLVADADVALNSTNDSITLALDPQNTTVVVDLIDLPTSAQTLADQVTNLINHFLPLAIAAVAQKFAPAPIPIPTIQLASISPAFAGRTGTFSGALTFDGQTQRIYLAGDLIAH